MCKVDKRRGANCASIGRDIHTTAFFKASHTKDVLVIQFFACMGRWLLVYGPQSAATAYFPLYTLHDLANCISRRVYPWVGRGGPNSHSLLKFNMHYHNGFIDQSWIRKSSISCFPPTATLCLVSNDWLKINAKYLFAPPSRPVALSIPPA